MYETKPFHLDNGQAVRIPEAYRLKEDETIIFNRVGSMLQLIPKSRAESVFREGVSEFTDDFLKEGRKQGTFEARQDL